MSIEIASFDESSSSENNQNKKRISQVSAKRKEDELLSPFPKKYRKKSEQVAIQLKTNQRGLSNSKVDKEYSGSSDEHISSKFPSHGISTERVEITREVRTNIEQ